MKNKILLDSFTKYCIENPEFRFWQALCGWSKMYIYKSDCSPILLWKLTKEKILKNLKDTFYE